MMASLSLERFKERLSGYVTDRKDFYHQAKVTRQRAASTAPPFSYPAKLFNDTRAFADLLWDAAPGTEGLR